MIDQPAPIEEIEQLVASSPLQLSVDEYLVVWNEITRRAPCRLLIFGCGKDSTLWIRANKGGRTLFIENNKEWSEHAAKHLAECGIEADFEIRLVSYWTMLHQWKLLLNRPWLLRLRMIERDWDVVFVDAPPGVGWRAQGRMRSIYTASVVACDDATIIVHDMDRELEQAYTARYLGPASNNLHRLSVWHRPAASR